MNRSDRQAVVLALFLTLSLIPLITGCRQRGAKGVGLLPAATPEETNFSKYQPKNPYAPLAPGMLTRTWYAASTGNGYRVEVRDLLVGPGQSVSKVSLPGSAVFEVRSGSGVLTAGAKRQELQQGSTFTLSRSDTFDIENKSNLPLTIRLHLFVGE